ncbi:M20/M25/M40 family metallo-hydrolase [Phycisphaerales bacterium AB-hyl4]|uniref:M20/M25/M40 family metallo-hydrolase n=1 Tax=Natronomicrosphaera hydrolytica TaxID=3242702 RepID=A0ABV4U5W5_9BACT
MYATAMKRTHERYLTELTSLPTAAGRESRVIAWIEAWAMRHAATVKLRRDRFGNLLLMRASGPRSDRPIIFAAHMDHPAFVVDAASDGRDASAEFRGGVHANYFKGTAVTLHRHDEPPRPGRVAILHQGDDARDKRATIRFDEPTVVEPGDVITWAIAPAKVVGDRLHAPACDDLAGVAAAIAAFEQLLKQTSVGDVRVLLTRAEEVGFIGAMAACRSRIMPKRSRIVALENSKSFDDSPIADGPIVRVGDRTSTFDPDLTYRVGKLAEQLASDDKQFKWQRKLMPGGTCEASAYQSLGYIATCVCLPLGNYHNMNERTGKIDAEVISLADYHALVRLLIAVGSQLDDPSRSPTLRRRLDALFDERRAILAEG